jgi:hypothetical protein
MDAKDSCETPACPKSWDSKEIESMPLCDVRVLPGAA